MKKELTILREADSIFMDVLQQTENMTKFGKHFVLLPIRTVGVRVIIELMTMWFVCEWWLA